MTSSKIRIESGTQLLARLTKKTGVEKFYPIIFENGPKHGDVIELYSEGSTNCLVVELICESLLPMSLEGPEAGVIIFNTDGNFQFDTLLKLLTRKILERSKNRKTVEMSTTDNLVQSLLKNLYVMDIFNVTEFYISIHNLENILAKYPNTSLVVFHTLTAFYWCEQDVKIAKMDLYLKKILCIIQKVVKGHKVTVLYTRPEYFSSSKETIDNLEPCYEHSTEEQLNYRIQIKYNDNINYMNIRTFEKQTQRQFNIVDDEIIWVL